jgi:hypothetical protein
LRRFASAGDLRVLPADRPNLFVHGNQQMTNAFQPNPLIVSTFPYRFVLVHFWLVFRAAASHRRRLGRRQSQMALPTQRQ